MKTKKIISIKELDNNVAQLFVSYCFLLRNKLKDDWFFTKKDIPEVMAVPQSYNGEISKKTKVLVRIGNVDKNIRLKENNLCKVINITAPFSSDQIITLLNEISNELSLKETNKSNSSVFSFKKSISKLFNKYINTKPNTQYIMSKSNNPQAKTTALLKLVDPNYHKNLKIVFLGRPGAGKTTAIVSAESKGLVKCEVNATDTVGVLKRQTTIGIDYCQCNLENGLKLKLYGTPGQGRYSQLQTQTVKKSDICITLIDLTSVAPYAEFKYYNKIVDSVNNSDTLKVVLFTHCDQNEHSMKSLSKEIKRASNGEVLTAQIDPRNRYDVRQLLKLLAKSKLENNINLPLESFAI